MIGKMYRPVKISSLHTKRGFHFQQKFKSNFLGFYEFQQDVYLHYEVETGTEVIRMEFSDLNVPLVLDEKMFKAVSKQEAVSNKKGRKVESLREIVRPGKKEAKDEDSIGSVFSNKEALKITMLVNSEKGNAKDNEWITIELKPIIINNREYISLNATADTQLIIKVNTSVELIQR